MKKAVFIGVIVIVLLNLPPIKWITGPDDILYSNAGGTFTFAEANSIGRDYVLCLENFNAFKSIHKKDTILYRITSKNIFKIWRWSDYLIKEKYKLLYKSWQETVANRGPVINKTNWQAF